MSKEIDKHMSEFCRLVYEGRNKREAYRQAFERPDMSDEAASKAATRVSKKRAFVQKMAELDKKMAEAADRKTILNRVARLEMLSEIVHRAMNPLDPNPGAAIRAISEMNKMEGAYPAAVVEEKHDVVVDFVQSQMAAAASEPLVAMLPREH